MSFANLLAEKIEASGKSLTEVAQAMEVSLPSLRGALRGRSFPNKRSLAKYAAFLGVDEAQCAELVKEAKASGGKPAKAGRKAAKAKPAASKPAKAGRKAAKAKASALSASLDEIADAIRRAEAVLADELVMKLCQLSGAKRKAAEAILASVI